MKKKLLTLILAALVALSGAFAFSACSDNETTNVNPPVGGNESEDEGTEPITFADFIKDHSDKAVEFYREKFSALTSDKQLLAETVSIGANSNNELSTLTAVYTYKIDNTKRKIDIVTANISPTVVLDDIVSGSVESVQYTTQKTTVFEFDSKENKENADLSAKLFALANIGNADLKVFSESEFSPLGGNVREFVLTYLKDGVYKTGKISVIVDNNTKENLMQNLDNPNKVFAYEETATYAVKQDGQATLYSTSYSLADETFKQSPTVDPSNPEKDPDDPSNPEKDPDTPVTPVDPETDKIEKVEDLTKGEVAQTVYSALNNTFLNQIGKTVFGKAFNAEKLIESKWDLGESDQINQIKFAATYESGTDNYVYGIGTITLASSIDVKNLTKDNINETISKSTASNYNRDYNFGYTKSIQGTRDSLVEAIFGACEHNLTEGSTRLFIDNGAATDGVGGINQAREFKVAEITDKGVNEFTVRVQKSSDDNEYVTNLGIEGNYVVINQKSEMFSGNFVTKIEN